ncbi:MAG TPA: DUF1611 domain-containing protein, partial [Candidatus Acidoferrales bacterium]|nr:DUF1611 domain-containing protein [Candidatus Acidoferrales bacterium]
RPGWRGVNGRYVLEGRRHAVLTEGFLTAPHGKTAHGVIRYRPEHVAAVIDSQFAGKRVCDVVPSLRSDAPIVASVREALAYGPRSLLIGFATDGGAIPPRLRAPIVEAIDAGLDVISGLHEVLADDPEIAARAAGAGVELIDVRVPPRNIPLFSGAVYRDKRAKVLAVGSDCAVGKMTAMLEVERAARDAGGKAEFVATGQTGILITGKGIAVDRVISDFVTGAAEQLVLTADSNADVVLVEGQGSIFHPAYAPVTFGLLYGSAPDALLLCHRVGLERVLGFEQPIPNLSALVEMHERILSFVKPARVIGVVLDTSALGPEAARAAIARVEEETGLPADDPVRNTGAKLWRLVDGVSNVLLSKPTS